MRQVDLFARRNRLGRPCKPGTISHLRREPFGAQFPVLVSLRVLDVIPDLRRPGCLAAIRGAFAAGNGAFGMRLVHFAVWDHQLHLICETDGELSLARGMQGLGIRVAKALNRAAGRKGRVFAERYVARVLRTPAEATSAVRRLLQEEITSERFPELVAAPVTSLLQKA